MSYRASTRFFDVHADDGPGLCGGEYERIDDLFLATLDAFGLDEPEDSIPLYLWSGLEDLPCLSSTAAGCYTTPAHELHAWTFGGALHHEVIHAATARDLSLEARVWSEGIAEALGTLIPPMGMSFDPRTLLEKDDFDYVEAAVFVSFIMESYGDEAAFGVFVDAHEQGVSAFEDQLGVPFDVIAEDFMATEVKCGSQRTRCSGPAVTFSQRWDVDETLTCGHSKALGALGQRASRSALVEFEDETELEITVRHGQIYLESCGPCATRTSENFSEGQATALDVSAGRYHVSMVGNTVSGRLGLSLESVSGP